jgi:dipeptidyl aminopeptidase/acylaminoacyl peptidase
MRRRTLLIAAGTTVAIGGAAYLAGAAVVYDRLTRVPGGCHETIAANRPDRFAVDGPPGFEASRYFMPPPEEVRFASRDPRVEVSGWFIPASAPDRPAVVVVHGHTACKRDTTVLVPAGMLHRGDYNVLLIDLRDHGDSTREDGRYAGGTDESLDVLGAWDWLRLERGFEPWRIGVVGISLGAATVLIAAGEAPALAAVWADSSYADIRVAIRAELTRNKYPALLEQGGLLIARLLNGDDLAARSPLDAVRRMADRRLAIVHGELDDRLSVEYGRTLAQAATAAGASVDSWFVAGAEHVQAMFSHADEYERRLVGFFDSALGAAR